MGESVVECGEQQSDDCSQSYRLREVAKVDLDLGLPVAISLACSSAAVA